MPNYGTMKQLARVSLLSSVIAISLVGCTLPTDQSAVNATNSSDTSTSGMPILSSDQLALLLLQPDDVDSLFTDIKPLPVEFDGQLDTNLNNYDFYLIQRWQAGANGGVRFAEQLTRYTASAAAQTNIAELASGCTLVTERVVGDASYICYTKPLVYYGGGDPDPANIIYLFSVGQYGVRIDVVDQGDPLDDDQVIYNRLLAIAYRLAATQQRHLETAVTNPPNVLNSAALDHLPKTLPNATLLGTAPITADQWKMLTADYQNPLTGFTSGGIRRFTIANRPNEVTEIIILEFSDTTQAQVLRDSLAQPTDTIMKLPNDLATNSLGVIRDNLVEVEAVSDRYFIDVSVFAPFTDSDTTAGQADAISDMQTTLAGF